MNYFLDLPLELQQIIYEYDPTFKFVFDKTLSELNRYNYPYK